MWMSPSGLLQRRQLHLSPLFSSAEAKLAPAAAVALLLLLLLLSATTRQPQQQQQHGSSGADCHSSFRVKQRGSQQQQAAAARKTASIVVVVTTKASTTDRRAWLRAQFSKNVALLRRQDPAAADGVVLRFAVGTVGLSDRDRNATAAEHAQHGDMLLLDIIDSNTPDPPPDGVDTATALKVIASASWAVHSYADFPWFVRLGDDSYFRVDHFLLHVAPTLSRSKLVFGYAEDPQLSWAFSHGVSITRYCSGMGFIMTHDVATYIRDNGPNLYKGYPEDAVVGLWLAGTNFRVQHDARLHDWEWRRCSNESIIIHKHDYGRVDDDGVMRSCFPADPVPPPQQP